MTLLTNIRPLSAEDDNYLPGIDKIACYSLWVTSTNWNFAQAEIEQLQIAFAPLRAIIWHGCSNKKNDASESKLLNKTIADGSSNKAAVADTVVQYSMYGKPRYSIVTWLSPCSTSYELMLPPERLLDNTVLAYLPDERTTANKWADAAHGFHWLWLCDEWIANAPVPALNAHSVALSYIRITMAIEGIASLAWSDSNMKKGLTFFASKEALERVESNLKMSGAKQETKYFLSLSLNGYYFDMCK
jgi:hypothetical protein